MYHNDVRIRELKELYILVLKYGWKIVDSRPIDKDKHSVYIQSPHYLVQINR